MKEEISQFIPLSPATLHILLSLAGEDRHGYAIMQEVARQSEGRYKLGPGTLYDNLQRLLDQGLVLERGRAGDSRRRYYRLSALGRGVLTAEVSRLETVIRDAKLHLQTARPAALIQGALLSAIFFGALIFAATNGARPIKFLIGSPGPRSGLLSLTRSSIEPAVANATVRVPAPAIDPWREFASRYFKIIYV